MTRNNTERDATESGRRGGLASAKALTAVERSTRAKHAASARKLKCECGKAGCITCYRRAYKRRARQAQPREEVKDV